MEEKHIFYVSLIAIIAIVGIVFMSSFSEKNTSPEEVYIVPTTMANSGYSDSNLIGQAAGGPSVGFGSGYSECINHCIDMYETDLIMLDLCLSICDHTYLLSNPRSIVSAGNN